MNKLKRILYQLKPEFQTSKKQNEIQCSKKMEPETARRLVEIANEHFKRADHWLDD